MDCRASSHIRCAENFGTQLISSPADASRVAHPSLMSCKNEHCARFFLTSLISLHPLVWHIHIICSRLPPSPPHTMEAPSTPVAQKGSSFRGEAPGSVAPPSPSEPRQFSKGEIDLAFDEPPRNSPTLKPVNVDNLGNLRMPGNIKVSTRMYGHVSMDEKNSHAIHCNYVRRNNRSESLHISRKTRHTFSTFFSHLFGSHRFASSVSLALLFIPSLCCGQLPYRHLSASSSAVFCVGRPACFWLSAVVGGVAVWPSSMSMYFSFKKRKTRAVIGV